MIGLNRRLRHQGGFIYLTTGANGTGKTAFTLREIREKQLKENRPVYWNGRFELTEDFGWTKIDAKDWQSAPDGTIFLFDECHNDFPNRPSASAVPPYVQAFGEHRKRGFDFFLLTQHPGNIDPFIRKIIASPGWHRHLKRAFGTSLVSHLDFNTVCDRPEKPGAGNTANVTMKALPKEVYGWYRSAELHTVKRKIPRAVWVLLACIVMVPILAFIGISQIKRNAGMSDKPKAATQAGAVAPGQAGGSQVGRTLTTPEYIASYEPRIAGLMHSAPAYDKLTEPRRVPVPAACIEMATKGCKCYTQDATPYPVDLALCRQLVQHGAFLAFLPEGEAQLRQQPPQLQQGAQQAPQQPSGLVLIGSLPQASPAAPALVPESPQRISSVKR